MIHKKKKYQRPYRNSYLDLSLQKRIYFIFFFLIFIFSVLIMKLFQVQVLSHDKYSQIAHKKHWGEVITPASRGEILVRDIGKNFYSLATNETLALVYVDPSQVEDKAATAGKLADILFVEACQSDNKTKSRFCKKEEKEPEESFISFLGIETIKKPKPEEIPSPEGEENLSEEEKKEPTLQEKKEIFAREIFNEINKKYRERILLMYNPPPELINQITQWGIMGIEANKDFLYVYPLKIKNPDLLAHKLNPFLEMGLSEIKEIFNRGNKKQDGRKSRLCDASQYQCASGIL